MGFIENIKDVISYLWCANISGKIYVVFLALCVISVPLITIEIIVAEVKVNKFIQENNCVKIYSKYNGTLTDTTIDTIIVGRDAYLCDGGVTYWR